MTDTSAAIATAGLTKFYGRKIGCSDISLTVPRGSVFGFLGPNGAGKSTFVKMMVGLIAPTSGDAQVLGRPLADFTTRARVGLLPENFRYQDWLSPLELLDFHGRLAGMERSAIAEKAPHVLARVGLAEDQRGKIRSFSKGMQQRLGLACALLAEPDLLFLDEPTSALDPIGRHDVREILVAERERGATVFLNSHLLSEVESICDEVAVIDHGALIESGRLADLLAGPCEVEITLAVPLGESARARMVELGGIVREEAPQRLVVGLPAEEAIPVLVTRLAEAGASITGVVRRRRTLEALFLQAVEEAEAHRG
jgi:ABC-2 type transport system ATP-binding protein